MATKLEKPLKREIVLNDAPYMLTISPEGMKLVPKGKRNGLELTWKGYPHAGHHERSRWRRLGQLGRGPRPAAGRFMPGFEFDKDSIALLREALERLEQGFSHLPAVAPAGASHDRVNLRRVLLEVAERMHDNYPYFHPLRLVAGSTMSETRGGSAKPDAA